MGHVSARPLREAGQGDDVPRRQHRGDRQPFRRQGAVAAARRRRLGRLGEDIAVRFLQRRGVRILGRNVRCGAGEIDIVAEAAGTAIVVEVKSVMRATGVDPAEAIDRRKSAALRTAAAALQPPIGRIDLITVVLDENGADVRWLPSVA